MLRLLADGHEGMWTPQSPIEHLVTPTADTLTLCVDISLVMPKMHKQSRIEFYRALSAAGAAMLAPAFAASGSVRSIRKLRAQVDEVPDVLQLLWDTSKLTGRTFPAWLKPSPLRKILQQKSRPRYVESLAPLLAALNQGRANQATHFSHRTDASTRRLAA